MLVSNEFSLKRSCRLLVLSNKLESLLTRVPWVPTSLSHPALPRQLTERMGLSTGSSRTGTSNPHCARNDPLNRISSFRFAQHLVGRWLHSSVVRCSSQRPFGIGSRWWILAGKLSIFSLFRKVELRLIDSNASKGLHTC